MRLSQLPPTIIAGSLVLLALSSCEREVIREETSLVQDASSESDAATESEIDAEDLVAAEGDSELIEVEGADPTGADEDVSPAAEDLEATGLDSGRRWGLADRVDMWSISGTMNPDEVGTPESVLPAFLGLLTGEGEMLLRAGEFDRWQVCREKIVETATILAEAEGEMSALKVAAEAVEKLSPEAGVEAWLEACKGKGAEVASLRSSLWRETTDRMAYDRFNWGLIVHHYQYAEWLRQNPQIDVPPSFREALQYWLEPEESNLSDELERLRGTLVGDEEDSISSAYALGIDTVAGKARSKFLPGLTSVEQAPLAVRSFVGVAQGVEAPTEAAGEEAGSQPSEAPDPGPQVDVASFPSEAQAILGDSSKILEKVEVIGGYRMFPDPVDKIMQFAGVLPDGVSARAYWSDHYSRCAVDLVPDNYADAEVVLPILFGVRMVDGFFAVQCEDANALRKVADDLRVIGKRLGGQDSDLERADTIPRLAENGQWVKVVTELSFLREDILRILSSDRYSKKRDLVMLGGWTQTARYVCPAVVGVVRRDEQRFGRFSSILREPLVVAETISGLATVVRSGVEEGKPLQDSQRNLVLRGMEVLNFAYRVVDIPPREPVSSLAEVEELGTMASKFVNHCVNDYQNPK